MKHNLFNKQRGYFISYATRNLTHLIFLCILLILSACDSDTALPTHLQTAPLTNVPTRLLIPLPSATFVPIHSPTISPTTSLTIEPTWPPQPSSTPLVPTPAAGLSYRFTNWTVEKAGQLIQSLLNNPDIYYPSSGYVLGHYDEAFKYAGLAELESAYRFSASEQAKVWRQDAAFHLLQSRNKDSGNLYAFSIAAALNRRETSLEGLPAWFFKEEPRLKLDMNNIPPPTGYQSSTFVHIYPINHKYFSGGFAIWLAQKEGEYFGYPLPNHLKSPIDDAESWVATEDITGDGIPEAILQNIDWRSMGSFDGEFTIYRLDQVPPQKIEITPEHDRLPMADWIIDRTDAVPTITFQIREEVINDRNCGNFRVGWQYQWQEGKLQLIHVTPPTYAEMEQNPICTRLLINRLGSARFFEVPAALETYQQLLEIPSVSENLAEYESADFIGHARLTLARYMVDKGDEIGAMEQMETLIASATPSTKAWRQAATEFISTYHQPQQLYQFCLSYKSCGSFLTLSEMIALIPSSLFERVETVLAQMGVGIHSSGRYDFDQDGQEEQWLLLQPSYGCGHEFWILANQSNGIKARYTVSLCAEKIERVEMAQLARIHGFPLYQISSAQASGERKFYYWPMDQNDPTIPAWETDERLDKIQNQLLLGQLSPEEAGEQVESLQRQPQEPNGMDHARILYLTGLIEELRGENANSIQTYLELWQTFPDSPYALMAFVKLEPVP